MNTNQYNKLKEIANKICGGDERAQDLLHDVLLQLTVNEKYNSLDEKGQLYFFIRAMSNQFYSNSSAFYRQYKRMNFSEIDYMMDSTDTEYIETPSIEWIKETLKNETENNPHFWYDEGIFNMYLELKKIQSIHKKTQIPKYSLRKTINDVKSLLKTRWEEENKDD